MSFPAPPPPHAGVVVDPAALARLARAAPSPGPAADRLAGAARDLVTALVAALPAARDRPAGGRSAPLARALADEWDAAARTWAGEVAEHLDRLARVGPVFAAVDEASTTLIAQPPVAEAGP